MRLVALALLLSGCSSILGLDDGTELVADAGLDALVLPDAPIVVFELFVDPNGDDANDGSVASPFRTISHAASQAQLGSIIRVAAGTYDEASGESFPITVGAPNVSVVGEVGGPQPARIVGDQVGPLVILNVEGSSLSDFDIVNATGDGVEVGIGGRVERCIIDAGDASGTGVRAIDGGSLESNQILNSAVGVFLDDGSGTVSGNIVFGNTIGLDVQITQTLELGENNELVCNNDADVRVSGGGQLVAFSTGWDHDPPTEGNLGGGIDITATGGSSVAVDAPFVSGAACP